MDDNATKMNIEQTPAEPSPFVRHDPMDRWIGVATWVVAAALILLLGYLGWNYYQDKRIEETQSPAARAVASLSAVVAKSPNNAMARVRLAEALMANNEENEAIEQLREALKIDKAFVPALTDLGLIAMERKEWDKAEAYWTQLITMLSGNDMSSKDERLADVYYFLGSTYAEQERYEEAIANLKQSISLKRDASPVHYMLAAAYGKLKLTEMQRQELEIVLAFDPTHAQANYDLGLLLLKEGDVATAAELFRKSADKAPASVRQPQEELDKLGDAESHLASARELRSTNAKKALSEARIAAALDPTSVQAVRLTAQLWEKAGNKEKARNAWERLLELAPGDTTATDSIKRLSTDAK